MSKKQIKARQFNHLSINKRTGVITKTSEDISKFIGEIEWYLKLPNNIKYVAPNIFSYSLDKEKPYVSMEYFSYKTIHELFLYDDLDKENWISIFTSIKNVCEDFSKYTVIDNDKIKSSIEDMYFTKTVDRLDKLRKDFRFSSYFDNDITINGITYKSLNDILEIIKVKIPEMLFDVESFPVIHGDLCFSNMLIDDTYSFVKLIDPRGKFGKFDIYGDFRYELAKLLHSIDGKYDFIIKDMFNINFNDNSIYYSVNKSNLDYRLYDVFIDVFKDLIGNDLKKIEFIESLLFLSMIPLHSESLNHQMAMLTTGIQILDRIIDIRR